MEPSLPVFTNVPEKKYTFSEKDPGNFELKEGVKVADSNGDSNTVLSNGLQNAIVQYMISKNKNRNKGERKDFHQKLFKTPKEATEALLRAAQKKALIPFDKLVVLGFFSGVFIAFGGIFALSITAGIPNSDPGITKGFLGLTFPIALALIIFFGGELFTGNTMFFTMGILYRKLSWKSLVYSWVLAYFSNFAGAVFGAYFFGYLTGVFSENPFLTYVQAIAVTKNSYAFYVAFLRAVAANWLVNLAIYTGIVAEDISGKLLSCFWIIGTFAVSGFEHSIANMFYVCLSLMYGADTTFGIFIYANLIPVTLGNIVGGVIMGVGLWYLYGTKQDIDRPSGELYTISCFA